MRRSGTDASKPADDQFCLAMPVPGRLAQSEIVHARAARGVSTSVRVSGSVSTLDRTAVQRAGPVAAR
jgi:hypothetical protein